MASDTTTQLTNKTAAAREGQATQFPGVAGGGGGRLLHMPTDIDQA